MLRDEDIQQDRTLRLSPESSSFSVKDLINTLVWIVLVFAGSLASYTFYDFGITLKQVRSDVSSLQTSFAALAQHVEDEDISRGFKAHASR